MSLFHFLFNKIKKNKKKTNKNKKNQIPKIGDLVSMLPPQFCCGGTLSFYALRAMLVSVVGVGVHWLNLTMRLLHVQCMSNFSNYGSFRYNT